MTPAFVDLPLGFLINTVGRLMAVRAARAFEAEGLDPTLVGVLWIVRLFPGRTQRQYARYQARDETTYGRMVDKLERLGLLRREPLAGDRRAWALTLTPEGESRLARLRAETEALEREFTSDLPHDAERAMRGALAAMLGALGGMEFGEAETRAPAA